MVDVEILFMPRVIVTMSVAPSSEVLRYSTMGNSVANISWFRAITFWLQMYLLPSSWMLLFRGWLQIALLWQFPTHELLVFFVSRLMHIMLLWLDSIGDPMYSGYEGDAEHGKKTQHRPVLVEFHPADIPCLPVERNSGELMKGAYTPVIFVMLGANARLLWDLLIIKVRILIAVALLDTLLYRLIVVHLATLVALDDWVGDLISTGKWVPNDPNLASAAIGIVAMNLTSHVLTPVAHFDHQRRPVHHGLVPVLLPAVAG
jgi:hypothetical protein